MQWPNRSPFLLKKLVAHSRPCHSLFEHELRKTIHRLLCYGRSFAERAHNVHALRLAAAHHFNKGGGIIILGQIQFLLGKKAAVARDGEYAACRGRGNLGRERAGKKPFWGNPFREG